MSSLFGGFAPKYKPHEAPAIVTRAALTRDNAYDLRYAVQEVENIQNLLGGDVFLREKAAESTFKQKANQYRILHFAMHAMPDSANPTFSKLLFTYNAQDSLEDNDLTAAELYTMHLNADLAVLSACQTGYGKINRGEGVMSLSRAFAYAGVPATVMSLWKVPDNATSDIMLTFYKNLKLGQTKDDALRNAKLSYLAQHPEANNPFFWAGFVAEGDMSVMEMINPYEALWIGGGLLVFLMGLGVWKRFKR